MLLAHCTVSIRVSQHQTHKFTPIVRSNVEQNEEAEPLGNPGTASRAAVKV